MGITERIIEVLKNFEVGLTYKNLLEQYKKNHHEELLWGYEHIKRLRNKNIIESFKAQNTKGKALTTFINRNKDNFTLDWLRGQKLTFESIYEMRK